MLVERKSSNNSSCFALDEALRGVGRGIYPSSDGLAWLWVLLGGMGVWMGQLKRGGILM